MHRRSCSVMPSDRNFRKARNPLGTHWRAENNLKGVMAQ